MKWTEQFTKWFEAGKEESETLLDIPWDTDVKVQDEEHELIIATHPKIPFNIEVYVTKHFASLYIDPGIPTDAMDLAERMRIYKKLLHINTDLNLMKAGLVGNEDRVVIAVDLDLASLNKKEFNDALTSLIIGGERMVETMGLTKELSEYMMERHAQMVITKLQEGESKEEVMDFLVHRVGLETEYAEEFMNRVAEIMQQAEDSQPGSSSPGPMYG